MFYKQMYLSPSLLNGRQSKVAQFIESTLKILGVHCTIAMNGYELGG